MTLMFPPNFTLPSLSRSLEKKTTILNLELFLGLKRIQAEGLSGEIVFTANGIFSPSWLTYMKNKETSLIETETILFAFWGYLC